MPVFGHTSPFKGSKGKGKGKTSPSPARTMLGAAVGRDQSRIYQKNVAVARAARQVVAGAQEPAPASPSTVAAPAVATASSSSGLAVAADTGGSKGHGKGSSGPSGATGLSVPSGAATGPPKGSSGPYDIDFLAHFAQETKGPPKGAETPPPKGQGKWIDYPQGEQKGYDPARPKGQGRWIDYPQGGQQGHDPVPRKGTKGKTYAESQIGNTLYIRSWNAGTHSWQYDVNPWYVHPERTVVPSPYADVSANWWPATHDWQAPGHAGHRNWEWPAASSDWQQPGGTYHPSLPPAAFPVPAGCAGGKGTKWRPTPYSTPRGMPGKGQDPPWVEGWFGKGKGNKKYVLTD